MNRTEFVIVTAIVLTLAFALGWFANWLVHRFTRVTQADLGELERMAHALHEAEETRDQAIAYIHHRDDETTREIAQLQAELLPKLSAGITCEDGTADRAEYTEHAAKHRRGLPFGAVPARDMADLVADDAGDLGLVLGEREEATTDIDIPARQGEGIDDFAVEQCKGEGNIGIFRHGFQPLADPVDIGGEFRVVIGTAILLQDLGMFLLSQTDIVIDIARGEAETAIRFRGGAGR